MALQESGQMYLETIHILLQKNDKILSIDIANHLDYSKPSVSRAMGILKRNEYITIDANGYIQLTDSGKKIAETLYERNTIISNLLIALGIDDKIATEDACRIEHVISDETFSAIKKHFLSYK